MEFDIVDAKGVELKRETTIMYGGLKPDWHPIMLPYAGLIKFQISFPGLGYRPGTKTIIDTGPFSSWILPDDGKTYILRSKLNIPTAIGDHPSIDWNGTLELPSVEIPRNK